MTRAEIIQALSNLPTATLEKLLTIADCSITPIDGQLTDFDYAKIIDAVFKKGGLADTHFPEWTDRSKSDFGRFLVELMALFSDKDFFYLNYFYNEAFVTKATQYNTLVHKALSIGLVPPGNVAAFGNFTLNIEATLVEEVVPRGAIEIGYSGSPDFTFTNDEFTIPASDVARQITTVFRHGIKKETYGNFNGKSIVLSTKNVAAKTIQLTIGGLGYTEVDSFASGNAATKHFMVAYDEEGRAEIYFAKGGYGVIPEYDASYVVSYLVGGGTLGNLLTGSLDKIAKNKSKATISGFTQFTTSGGSNLLPMETLRQKIVNYDKTGNRILNSDDAARLIKELDFVYNSKAISRANFLYIYVVPKGSKNLTESQNTAIDTFINKKLVMDKAPLISTPVYTAVTMKLNVYILPQASRAQTRENVQEVVDSYTNPQINGQFGEGIKRYKLANLIMSRVQYTQNVDFEVLQKNTNPPPYSAPADLEFYDTELIDVDNSVITINIIGGQE